MSTSQLIPYPLRMPDELRELITAQAKANNRSLNTEIVLMLQQVVESQASKPGGIDIEALADALAPKLVAKMRDQQA